MAIAETRVLDSDDALRNSLEAPLRYFYNLPTKSQAGMLNLMASLTGGENIKDVPFAIMSKRAVHEDGTRYISTKIYVHDTGNRLENLDRRIRVRDALNAYTAKYKVGSIEEDVGNGVHEFDRDSNNPLWIGGNYEIPLRVEVETATHAQEDEVCLLIHGAQAKDQPQQAEDSQPWYKRHARPLIYSAGASALAIGLLYAAAHPRAGITADRSDSSWKDNNDNHTLNIGQIPQPPLVSTYTPPENILFGARTLEQVAPPAAPNPPGNLRRVEPPPKASESAPAVLKKDVPAQLSKDVAPQKRLMTIPGGSQPWNQVEDLLNNAWRGKKKATGTDIYNYTYRILEANKVGERDWKLYGKKDSRDIGKDEQLAVPDDVVLDILREAA